MGLFNKLFKSRKAKDEIIANDGQGKYFKDEETPKKKAFSPKEEVKAEEKKPDEPKTETKIDESKRHTDSRAETKKEESKKPTASKAEAKKTVQKSVKQELPADDDISADDEEVAVEAGGKPVRNGKFDIRKSKDGRFYFNLYASNKQVIAYSQMYASITGAINGIKSVIANAPKAAIEDTTLKKPESKSFPKWEIYIDKAGEYRFRLYATNGSCICHSHGYASKATCKGGMESIQRFASESADIDKSYLNK